MPYSPLLVKPMREELTQVGFTELLSAEDVDRAMEEAKSGTTLAVFNFVDGCSAAVARPGVRLALENGSKRPDRLVSVFAQQDFEATARMRSHFEDIPPSEPSMALFQDGELVYFLPRHRIEARAAQQVAADLTEAFNEFGK
ncbi:BrxA/BrxB family bacilliredoxin [Kitasatospora sp. NBC_00240]|uniref:BrxA/BrxB family bacilliredoxin n=1 Tax=Kitasatospora sp. NBC_00240 TaxID=2903567 RepID=UPI00225421E0|nr:BrxA/BrxB family bacilliredoxin [Kitasatospora sp. NBC_00240]MCX5216232.1 BrxA/BrxB family bacilliredoxin [Kitasatospora sp. NBC_00240]